MAKDINQMLREAIWICKSLNIQTAPVILINWNSRLRSVWGKCKRTDVTYKNVGIYTIELNTVLNDDRVSYEDAMSTVIHEVLHAYPSRFCHTGEWKRCAELVNAKYPQYCIKRCTSAEQKGIADVMEQRRHYRYEVHCMNCGFVDRYQKAGPVVRILKSGSKQCRCSCGSYDLKLIEL